MWSNVFQNVAPKYPNKMYYWYLSKTADLRVVDILFLFLRQDLLKDVVTQNRLFQFVWN